MSSSLGKFILRSFAGGLGCGFLLFGSAACGDSEGYVDQLWQVADGLPNAQVRAIIQSRDGFLWVGTVEGLARFDGTTFTMVERRAVRQMTRQYYIGLAEDREGGIWFSNGHGLSRHQDGKREFYGTNNGLPSDYVLSVFCDSQGEVIAGTDKGLCKFQAGNFVALAGEDPIGKAAVRAIVEDQKGNLWFGATNGLFKFRDGKFSTSSREQALIGGRSVFALAQGTNGQMWVGTATGLVRIEENGATDFTVEHGLLTNTVRALRLDKAGTLWVGTSVGLQRLANGDLPFILQANSFAAEFDGMRQIIYAITEDNENNIWVGSNQGLIRLKRERFKVYSVKEGLPHRVVDTVLEDSHGRIWIGTAGGIARIENGKVIASLTVTNETRTNQFPRTEVLSLMEDAGGDMWFGTRTGVYRMKTNALLHYTAEKSKLADDVARCILQLTARSYWIGNNRGLTRYRFLLFTNFAAKVGLPFTNVKALAEGKEKRLWVGSEEGLTVFKGDTFKRFTMKDGLSSEWINALYVDKNETLWIGTENGGLDRFKEGRVAAITPSASGIFSERIYSIVEDDRGNLWMGSRHGICRASKKELEDFADGKITSVHCVSYGKEDGLRNIQCSGNSQPAAWKGRDGRLWFATLDGVAVIDSRNLIVNRAPPKISMQRVVVDGQPVTPTNQMRFPPGEGNLQFEYAGICLQAPEKVRFQYRLEGVDSTWVDAGTRRIASYANLGPGTYRFLIRAGNNDEFWSEKPSSFGFTLLPHVYQTTAFYAVSIVSAVFALIGLHLMRVRRHELQARELSALVAKRTQHLEDAIKSMETFTYSVAHDLRAPLRAIAGMTGLLVRDYRGGFDATGLEYGQRIQQAVRRMEELIRDFLVYGLVAHSKTPVERVSLEQTFEKVCAEVGPQIQAKHGVIEIAKTGGSVMANPVLLEQVLANIVSNGIKFVAPETAPHLRIWTEPAEHNVRIFVEDNGIGIERQYQERIFWLFERLHGESDYPGTGVGLAIVQKGVERMGGKVGVESEMGKGSRFWLELPAAN